jgi:hypothetical protein
MGEDHQRTTQAVPARWRNGPILVTAVVLSTGMAYCLLWGPVIRHSGTWVFPGDIWGAYRSAHFIAWGSLGNVYAAGTRLVTFPGILVLLAPLALLTGSLGMSESFPQYIAHPTAWLLLGPYEILIGCSALFACDALAARLGISPRRRLLVCVAEGVVLWPVLVAWGHPEDALGLALAVYALVATLDRRWTAAGWLLGAAVATQPLVLLMVPVVLVMAGGRRWLALSVRTALPTVFLLATPLMAEFRATVHALFDQPNFPNVDHLTPWTTLAPRLGGTGANLAVAAGPGRLVALLAACGLGWWARRWRDRPDLLVWATAAALALRCLTESVMDAYYVWPTLALGLVVLAPSTRGRMVLGLAAAGLVTVSAQTHLGEWAWWTTATILLLVVLVAAFPPRASRVRDQVPILPITAGSESSHDQVRALAGVTR